VLSSRIGPFPIRWVAEHSDYVDGRQFCDEQREGPFRFWRHTHRFEDRSGGSVLRDEIEYELPAGVLGSWLGSRFVRDRLVRMFRYRHRTTRDDLSLLAARPDHRHESIAVSGSHGLVGRELIPLLTTGGFRIVRLVRRAAADGEVHWSPELDRFDATPLEGLGGVVHLAGENIASGRWSTRRKELIRRSRVDGTRVLCEGLARLKHPPRTLIAASAIGFYGDRGDEWVDEQSASGEGFLSEVARQWEAATRPASEAGIRVVLLRLGVVLSPRGGALANLLPPFRCGVGGRIGRGDQYWSWVSIDDVGGAVFFALTTPEMSGPINVVAPQPVTNGEFARILGRVLGRPACVPFPAVAARALLGEMADALLLSSTRVRPTCLLDVGFPFRHTDLESALRHLLGR
jgi:uncharacterized protein